MKPGGQTMSMGQVSHDELMIPSLQPRLRPGKRRNIPYPIGYRPAQRGDVV